MDTRFLHRLVRLLEPKRGLPDLDTSTITANHTHLGYERFVIVLLALLILGVASMPVHAYAAVPPTAEQTQTVTLYTVRSGDTLSAIARRYGTTVQAIMAANGLTSTRIYAGQQLRIPQGPQTPPSGRERIQFAAGATSAVRTGTVQNPMVKEYTLRALQGQTLRVELITSDTSGLLGIVGLSDGIPYKRMAVAGTVFEMVLPRTQDYLIQIGTPNNGPVTYELYVEVPPLPAPGAPERIQFAPGAVSATVQGYTTAIAPKRYVLRARAGQTMSVDLYDQSIHTYITVLTPSGAHLAATEGPLHHWMGQLPVTGDYIVEVRNAGQGSVDFSLTVAIR